MYDDDDDRYRELEDELYQDQESNGSRSGSVDSDVEEQLWSNVLYTAGMDDPPKPPVVVIDDSAQREGNQLSSGNVVDEEDGEIIEEDVSERREEEEEEEEDNSDVDDDSRYESISKQQLQKTTDISVMMHAGRRGSDSSSSAEEEESENAINGIAKVTTTTVKRVQQMKETDNNNNNNNNNNSPLVVTKIIDLNQIAVQSVQVVPDSSAYDYLDAATADGPSRYFLPQSDNVVCRKCNQVGHKARDCQAKKCNNCGEIGHFSDECPHLSVVICHNCNRRGHINRDCPEPKRRGGMEKCYRCGSFRHHTDECPATWRLYVLKETSSPPGELRPWCFNCSSKKHFGDSCELPRCNVYNGSGNIESAFSDLHVAKKRRGENDVIETDTQRRAREAKEDLIRSEINRFRSGGDRYDRHDSRRSRRRDDDDYDYDDRDYDSRRRDRSNESGYRNRSRDRNSYRDGYRGRDRDSKHYRQSDSNQGSRHQRSPYQDNTPPQYSRPENLSGNNGNGSILPPYAQRQPLPPPPLSSEMFRPMPGSAPYAPSPPKPLYRGGYSRG